MSRLMLALLSIFCCFVAVSAARASDALIEGARQCTQHFPVQEREKNIPVHLLAAIASAESGRWHKELGMPLPWPWTINVEGQGYYFNSKAEAIARTQAFMKQGKRSIDVGCMQVNLKHHAGAFRTLQEAFDPAVNVAYAAEFLRNNYDDLGDWIKATAAYHSRTSHLGRKYLARIEQTWNRIVSKVQAAQVRAGASYKVVNAQQNPLEGASRSAAPYMAEIQSPNRIESTRNVKVIQVSQEVAPRDEMLVVSPEQDTPALAVASVQNAVRDELLVKGVPFEARASVDNASQTEHKGPKAQFIFSN